jgi:hypothetical protein
MAGIVGRTLAGKALDEHITIYKNQTLRRRICRTLAQMDRAFLWSKNDPWERGVIYASAASVIKRKFPQKRLALLRKHLYAYAESLFKKVYVPETLTQIAILERAEQEKLQQLQRRQKHERDEKFYELGSTILFYVLSFILILTALRP